MKYLRDEEIQVNHWYEDKTGEQLLYLGMASQKNLSWEYPTCHIYLKKSILQRGFKGNLNDYSVKDFLIWACKRGVRCYQFSEKPRKFLKEADTHPNDPLRGLVNVGDDAASTFYFF